MKNLKTTIFSVAMFGTTFIALSYFCRQCGTNHRLLLDCPAYDRGRGEASDTIVKEYVFSLVKDEIEHCRNVGEANRVINRMKCFLETKELEVRYSELFEHLGTQEAMKKIRKGFEDLFKLMIDCSDYNLGCDGEVLDWSKVFGSDSETAPNSPNHRDGSNESSNEPEPWDSGYARILPGC